VVPHTAPAPSRAKKLRDLEQSPVGAAHAPAQLAPEVREQRQAHLRPQTLELPEDDKARLLAMTPGNYIGKAVELAERI